MNDSKIDFKNKYDKRERYTRVFKIINGGRYIIYRSGRPNLLKIFPERS